MYSPNLTRINRWTVRASLEFYRHVVLRGVVPIFTEHDILINKLILNVWMDRISSI